MQSIVNERNVSLFITVLSVLLMFFLPISTTIKSILIISCVLAILCTPHYYPLLRNTFSSIWGIAACSFFIFVLIAALWSPAPVKMQVSVIEKYVKLLYLPILTVAFIKPNTRQWGLHSFLIAVLLMSLISILKAKGLWFLSNSVDQGEIFNNHIVTGFIIAFGSYLSSYFFLQSNGWRRVSYFLLFIITSYQVLFINTGRTGYFIYFVLMIFLLLQQLTLKKALLGIIVFGIVLALSFSQSSMMQEKFNALMTELHQLKEHKMDNSLGFRMQFHEYASSLFFEHPIKGQGTGSFKYRFSQDLPIPSWGNSLTEPHSQYWMTLAEMGLIGISFLLLFLGSLFVVSLKLRETKPILLGFLVVFSIACFSDTVFCYSVLGYLLIVFSALCLGEMLEESTKTL